MTGRISPACTGSPGHLRQRMMFWLSAVAAVSILIVLGSISVLGSHAADERSIYAYDLSSRNAPIASLHGLALHTPTSRFLVEFLVTAVVSTSRSGRNSVLSDAGVGAESVTGPGGAALDTNVLIRGLDNGELDAVDKALAGRSPIVSPTAASEYLTKGSQDALDQFLADRGGSIGAAGTQEGAAALQAQAAGLGRSLGLNDALIAHSAMQEGVPLITGDSQLLRFLNAIGYPGEGF